jgi:hypothetical protein
MIRSQTAKDCNRFLDVALIDFQIRAGNSGLEDCSPLGSVATSTSMAMAPATTANLRYQCNDWFTCIQTVVKSDPEACILRKRALNVDDKGNDDQFVLLHGVLSWRSEGTLRVYVPLSLRKQLLQDTMTSPSQGM